MRKRSGPRLFVNQDSMVDRSVARTGTYMPLGGGLVIFEAGYMLLVFTRQEFNFFKHFVASYFVTNQLAVPAQRTSLCRVREIPVLRCLFTRAQIPPASSFNAFPTYTEDQFRERRLPRSLTSFPSCKNASFAIRMPQMILDSHVHLWPASAANPQAHKWMVEGAHLTRQFLVDDYLAAANSLKARDVNVSGFIYVETDRVVGEYDPERPEVETWATEPLREIALLRRIVEGEPEAGQTSNGSHADLLKGIVAWAPCDKGFVNFLHYLNAAAETARPETWSRIKGFRFLVQGMRDEEDFRQLPELPSFTEILRYMGMQGYSFDVGVDQRQGGVWQLEGFADVVEAVHRWIAPEDQTVFILSKQ